MSTTMQSDNESDSDFSMGDEAALMQAAFAFGAGNLDEKTADIPSDAYNEYVYHEGDAPRSFRGVLDDDDNDEEGRRPEHHLEDDMLMQNRPNRKRRVSMVTSLNNALRRGGAALLKRQDSGLQLDDQKLHLHVSSVKTNSDFTFGGGGGESKHHKKKQQQQQEHQHNQARFADVLAAVADHHLQDKKQRSNDETTHQATPGPMKAKLRFKLALAKAKHMRSGKKGFGLSGLTSDEEGSSYGSDGSLSKFATDDDEDGGDCLVDFPISRQEFLEQREQQTSQQQQPQQQQQQQQTQAMDDSSQSKSKEEVTNYEMDQRKPWRRSLFPKAAPKLNLNDSLSSSCFFETGPALIRRPKKEQLHEKISSGLQNDGGDRNKDDTSQLTENDIDDESSIMSELLLAQTALGWKEEDNSDRSSSLKDFSFSSLQKPSSRLDENARTMMRRTSTATMGNMPQEMDTTGTASRGMPRLEEHTDDDSEPHRSRRGRDNSIGPTGGTPVDAGNAPIQSDLQDIFLRRSQLLSRKPSKPLNLTKSSNQADPLWRNSDHLVSSHRSSNKDGATHEVPTTRAITSDSDKITNTKDRIAQRLAEPSDHGTPPRENPPASLSKSSGSAANSGSTETKMLANSEPVVDNDQKYTERRQSGSRREQKRSSSLSKRAGETLVGSTEAQMLSKSSSFSALDKDSTKRRRSESDFLPPTTSQSEKEDITRRGSGLSFGRRSSTSARLMEMAMSTASRSIPISSTPLMDEASEKAAESNPKVVSDDDENVDPHMAKAEAERRSRKDFRRKRHRHRHRHRKEEKGGEKGEILHRSKSGRRSKSRHRNKSKRLDGKDDEEVSHTGHRSRSRRKHLHHSKSRRHNGEEDGDGDQRLHRPRRHRENKKEGEGNRVEMLSIDGIVPIPGDDKSLRTAEDLKEEERLDYTSLADESGAITSNGSRASKTVPPLEAPLNTALLAVQMFSKARDDPNQEIKEKEDADLHNGAPPKMTSSGAAPTATRVPNNTQAANLDYDAPPSATLDGLSDDEDNTDFENIKPMEEESRSGDIEKGRPDMNTTAFGSDSVQVSVPLKSDDEESQVSKPSNATGVVKALSTFHAVFKNTQKKGETQQSFYGLWAGRDDNSMSPSLDSKGVGLPPKVKKKQGKVTANLKVTMRTTSWGLKMQRIFGPRVWAWKWYILAGIILFILALAIAIPLASDGGGGDDNSAPTPPAPQNPAASPTIAPIQGSFFYEEIAELLGSEAGDNAGSSVSISVDGRYMAAGSPQAAVGPGEVRIYARGTNDNYVLFGNPIVGVNRGDLFGFSVSMSDDGQIVCIGAPTADDDLGYAVIYRYNLLSSLWEQVGNRLTSVVPDGRAGSSVSISGNGERVAIGIPRGNDFDGITLVYQYSSLTELWTRLGQRISGANGELNGFAISLDERGNTLAIGAVRSPTPTSDRGRVYLLRFSEDQQWQQLGQAIIGSDLIGRSISLASDGRRVAIGSTGFDSGFQEDVGACQVFEYVDTDWVQLGSTLAGEEGDERSGFSVSLSRNGLRLACGGPGKSVVRLYREQDGGWQPLGGPLTGQPATDYGAAVALTGDGGVVVVGVPEESVGDQSNIGLVQIYRNS